MGGLRKSSSKDSKRVAKAAKEELPTSIDRCLVDAVHHPQFREKMLCIEAKIQQVLKNPNIEKVEFPECHTAHLKSLADKLALHYCLESHCKERRSFARKTPDSKIPSVTLSEVEMDLPKSSSEDSKRVAKATEEEPPTSIDRCLVEAVHHPQFREKMLCIEAKIQQVLKDPNLEKVEFPECHTSHLKSLADKLALHYRLESHCKERRAFARKTPDSKIPSVTLSGIPDINPKDKLPILIKGSNGVASFSTLSAPELTEPVNREDEYYKARKRIFNESVPASSTAPLVSSSTPPLVPSSISPTHSGIVEESDQDTLSDRHAATNPAVSSSTSPEVSSPISPVASNSISPVVPRSISPVVPSSISPTHSGIIEEGYQDSLSDRHAAMNPAVSSPISPVSSNSISPLGPRSIYPAAPSSISLAVPSFNDRHAAMNPVHNPGVNRNRNRTRSIRYHRGTGAFIRARPTGQQPLLMQNDATNFRHQVVQYEPRIQQSQMYQYVPSIQQPQMMQYEPSIAQSYMFRPNYNYYPYYASSAPYNPAYSSYPQWPSVQPMQSFSQQPIHYNGVSTPPYYASSAPYNPAYSSYTQQPWVQPMQSFSQQPMQYQPGPAQQPSDSIIQNNQPETAQQPSNSIIQNNQPETAQQPSNSIIQNNQDAVTPGSAGFPRQRRRTF